MRKHLGRLLAGAAMLAVVAAAGGAPSVHAGNHGGGQSGEVVHTCDDGTTVEHTGPNRWGSATSSVNQGHTWGPCGVGSLTVVIHQVGEGTVSGDGTYQYADDVTLTADPDPGWTFEGWAGDDECGSSSFRIISNVECTATFLQVPPDSYEVTLAVNPPDSGTATGPGSYNDGEAVELDVTPESGWVFDSWGGDEVCASSFTITEDTHCIANFVEDDEQPEAATYEVTIGIAGEGSATGEGTYDEGQEVTLTATPDEGWEFEGWSGHSDCGDEPFNITGDVECTATFVEEEEESQPRENGENGNGNGGQNGPSNGGPGTVSTPTPTPTPTPAPTEEPEAESEEQDEPEVPEVEIPEVEVLGTAAEVRQVLTSGDPASVGETVTFEVTVRLSGDSEVQAGMVEAFDPAYLEHVSASADGCTVVEDYTEDGLDAVVCDLGTVDPAAEGEPGSVELTHEFTFTAVASTLPGRTATEAYASVNGSLLGPAVADVEIVEVLGLTLPEAGDGPMAGGTGDTAQQVLMLGALVLAAAGAGVGTRRLAIRHQRVEE